MPLQKPKPVRAVNGSTLQHVEKFKCHGVVFTGDGRSNKQSDKRIGKANTALYVSFMAFWSQNGSFPTPQNCQFSNRPLLCPHLWSWILGNDWQSAISSTSGKDVFFC